MQLQTTTDRLVSCETELDRQGQKLDTSKREIEELSATHADTIEKLHNNYTRQAELNKSTLSKYTQHVGLLQLLLTSQEFSTRRLHARIKALESELRPLRATPRLPPRPAATVYSV